MEPILYRLWDKRAHCMEYYYQLQITPLGQIYYNGMNVSQYYDQMLCSGMKDQEQHFIYEGDIIVFGKHHELSGVVRFVEGCFMVNDQYLKDCISGCLVSGNVYENPIPV